MLSDQREVCSLSRGVISPAGSTPIRVITTRPSLAPSSSTRYPISVPYGPLSPQGGRRAYHVPHEYHDGVGSACPPVAVCLRQESAKLLFRPRTFWFKPFSIFGLSTVTTFSSGSLLLARPSTLAPDHPDAGSRHLSSRVNDRPKGRGYVVPEALAPSDYSNRTFR